MLFDPSVKTRPEDFYDFRKELDALQRGLSDPLTRMIVIKGIRRIGKSSLLRVGLGTSGKPHIIFDVRQAGEVTADSIYHALQSGLEEALRRMSRLREALSKVESLDIAGFRVRFRSRRPPALYEVFRALDEASPGPGGLIVAIDEAQYLAGLRGFARILAHVYDYLRGLKIVLTGSEVGLLDRLLGRRDPSAPLYGRPALEITMKRFPRDTSVGFLATGFRELGIEWPRRHVEEAVDTLDGVPGWLTYYGYQAYQTGSHERALRETLGAGAAIAARELDSFLGPRRLARNRYLALLRCLQARPMRWSELRRCVEAETGAPLAKPVLYRYLRELQDYSFVEKTREGAYRLSDPLYGRALELIR